MPDLSRYVLEVLRNDEEFVLYRGKNPNQPVHTRFFC